MHDREVVPYSDVARRGRNRSGRVRGQRQKWLLPYIDAFDDDKVASTGGGLNV